MKETPEIKVSDQIEEALTHVGNTIRSQTH